MPRKVKKTVKSKSLTLTMQNSIMSYSASLGTIGAKIFRYAIATINTETQTFDEIRIRAKDLAAIINCSEDYLWEKGREFALAKNSQYGIDENNYFNQFANASLVYFPEKDKNKWMYLHLWSYFGYDHGEFTFQLNNDFASFLLNIDPQKGGYFRTEFEDYVPCATSETEIILYEQLIQRKYLAGKPSAAAPGVELESNEIIFDIPWLRKLLCAEQKDKYERDRDFFAKCIKPATENINARTKLKVECEAVNAEWGTDAITHIIFRYLDIATLLQQSLPEIPEPSAKRTISQKQLEEMRIDVCKQIEYPLVTQAVMLEIPYPPSIKETLNCVVDVMAETLCQSCPEDGIFPDPLWSIGDNNYDAEYIYTKLKAVTNENMVNLIIRLLKTGGEIINSKNYIISSLINEVTTNGFGAIMRETEDSIFRHGGIL